MKVVISVPFDLGHLEFTTCEDEVTAETDHLHYVFKLECGLHCEELKGEIVYEYGDEATVLIQRFMQSYQRITFALMKQKVEAHELFIH